MDGLIGASGFIGSNVLRLVSGIQTLSREEIAKPVECEFRRLFIAAPSAEKWKIALDPQADFENVEKLANHLTKNILAEEIVLFSTVDVYSDISDSDENSKTLDTLSYGGNRRYLEERIVQHFPKAKVCRVGGLFGPGLKKNILYDLKNDRTELIHSVNRDSKFQFLPVDRVVFASIEATEGISNIVGPPIFAYEIPGIERFKLDSEAKAIRYDIKTCYSETGYLAEKSEVLKEVVRYLGGANI